MADYNSSLPVRTENAGDVIAKIADATTPSQQLAVDSSGRISTKIQDSAGNNLTSTGNALDVNVTNASIAVTATDLDIRDLSASQDNVAISDGTDTLAVNADGSINSVVTATNLDIRDLSHSQDSVKVGDGTDFLAVNADGSINSVVTATDLDIRDLSAAQDNVAISDGSDTLAINNDGSINAVVTATDLDIRDLSHSQDSVKVGDGTDFLAVNSDGSINVVISSDVDGSEICDYQTSASVAGGASVNLDYTVTALKTLLIQQVFATGSGKIKVEVKAETAPASGTYNTKFVGFNSTANPNVEIDIDRLLKQVAGAKVRVTITNRDNQSQDVYSTLTGTEI